MTRLPLARLLLLALLVAAPSFAADKWYDSYDKALAAAKKGNWADVIEKMTAAIAEKPEENRRAHSYGTIFLAYHPYYYRGIAYFELGRYDEAIRDLKRATGVGPEKLGDAATFLMRAETQLAAAQAPPTPTQTVAQQPTPTQPVVSPPTTPAVDPNLAPARKRARELITEASGKMAQARRARADALPDFSQAEGLLTDAQSKALQSDTAADWTAVASSAEKASIGFDLAIHKAQIADAQKPPTPAPAVPATDAATSEATASFRRDVRSAVEAYFSGEFTLSAQAFDTLSRRQPDNALIWAFLGASRYYEWYLNGQSDEQAMQAAVAAFREARRSNRRLKLNERYFPKRVQNFYETVRLE